MVGLPMATIQLTLVLAQVPTTYSYLQYGEISDRSEQVLFKIPLMSESMQTSIEPNGSK